MRAIVSRTCLVTCLLASLLARPGISHAATETVVPWDESGLVLRLDAELRQRVDLWPGLYPHFEEARILRDRAGGLWLQVAWRDGTDLVQDRTPLPDAELDALRRGVSAALSANPVAPPTKGTPAAGPVPNERVPFLVATTVVGLGFYSWGVPVSTDLDGKTAVSVGMLCAGASFVLPYLATRHETVTPGMANLGIYGLTRGIAYGALLHRLATGPGGSGDSRVGAAAIGSAVGATAGYLWAREAGMDAGRAHLVETGGDLGLLAGVELAVAANLRSDYLEPDHGLEYVSTLGGAALGLAGGALRGAHSSPTWGDAEVHRTTSLLVQGISVAAWDLGTDNRRTIAGAALGGAVVGAYLGDRLTDQPDFTVGQAVLVDLATVAGGALGLGTAYLLGSRSGDFESEAYLPGTALGATAGYALAYLAFAKRAVGHAEAGAGADAGAEAGAAAGADAGAAGIGLQPYAHLDAPRKNLGRIDPPIEYGLAFSLRF